MGYRRKSIDDRVKNTINNLLPRTGFRNRFGPPQALESRMAHYHTPGASIAVINDFKIEWARGFGLCDARFKRKVGTDTLFQAASISKPICALGVLRLAQGGHLDLDADIHQYIHSWRVPSNEGWVPRITLRQLLSHTGGTTVHGFPGYQTTETLPTALQILNGKFPANTARVEVNLLPGTQYRYSGGGFTIVQQALVDMLQKPFPRIMDKLVFEPLGLTNSTFRQPLSRHLAENAATAHPRKGIPLKGRFHIYPEMAAAGLWTTAADLARVGLELQRVLHNMKIPALLDKETIESMLSPQLDHQMLDEGGFTGLGFGCEGKEERFHFGHGGRNEGFVSQVFFYKNKGKGAVIMLNSDEGEPLIDEIMRAIASEYGWPEMSPTEKSTVALANTHDYTGTYKTNTGMKLEVLGEKGILAVQYGEQPPFPIFPSSDSEFFAKSVDADVRFEKSPIEGIVSLILSQGFSQIKANKQCVNPK